MNKINQIIFKDAKWIWAEGIERKNDLCIFKKVFSLTSKPKKMLLRIACDTHYYLNVNGRFVVWEGGINHSAGDGFKGYYDEIQINKLLKKGENSLAIICRYYGNSGNDSQDKGRAGLIAEMVTISGDVILVSNSDFLVCRNQANKDIPDLPAVNFAGFSYCYDATAEAQLAGVYLPSFKSSIFSQSTEICSYKDEPFGEMKKRTLPFYTFNEKPKFTKKIRCEKDDETNRYYIRLPRAMHVYPVMKLKAQSMEKIKIYTDRTVSSGDFGDSSVYTAPHIEYICKAQKQSFESFMPIYGQNIYFETSKTVKLSKLGYRFTEYDSCNLGYFTCSDPTLSTLFEKGVNTLKACLTDRIINNPERDRATTLDSANIAVKSLLKIFDQSIVNLVRKTVTDVLDEVTSDTIYSNVPSNSKIEIPSLGLLTISELGMFASYSDYFSDMDSKFLECAVNYLKKWDIQDYLIVAKGGWTDNMFNIDNEIIENCLYYSALKYAKSLCKKSSDFEYIDFINSRLEGFSDAFNDRFYDGAGYSSHTDFYDDRANALTVLTGLCDAKYYEGLSKLIANIQSSSPYLEGFVTEALCVMNKSHYARERISSRYSEMSKTALSTLSEEFYECGAKTASRSVMQLSVMLEYFCGVKIEGGGTKITVTPDLAGLDNLSFAHVTPKGIIKGEYTKTAGGGKEFIIRNDSKTEVTVLIKKSGTMPPHAHKLSKGKVKYTCE